MKFFFLRAVAYVGLYAEIFSATCRWLSYVPSGWSRRSRWKSFVTEALVAAFYLPPPPPALTPSQIVAREERKTFHLSQPQNIQRCLRANAKILAIVRSLPNCEHEYPRTWWADAPALPKFLNDR